MHPVRKQRLILVIAGVVFSSIAIGLIVYAMRENINLFYPPSKIASGEAPHNRAIRGGGCVKPGSVVRASDSLDIKFVLTDGIAEVPVKFSGILPDLFAEGEAAVVNGKVDEKGIFNAEQVLAKHDETYTPPEVASMNKGDDHKNDQAVCKGMNYGS
ncbi:cytochrome c-type biogenesis protein CcmE [Cellvibrio zantedeschiae]|uniref:Cytochrome c-type biogenesis protein CcmE n=1 Tax=Cellvibrio zantedeschiae TaxID=1237077 RepID=A0ABQ3AYM8_9GAMM|nr:cytochrome c maturation protein CcmE [Cellvibrio zantedeschiae]GGY71300.1 cytochrome c-type biogenesis protein CcmE [Cellvibrio zantedeschiae]